MNNVSKMIKLDIISIAPYFTLKNLLIITALSIFYMFISNNPVIIFSIPVFFSILYSSYPFLIGEESGIDGLYRIFGIKSKEVVQARYIISLLMFVLGSLIGFIFLGIYSFIGEEDGLRGAFIYCIVNFILYILITSLTFPIYFKYGYTKAKGVIFIPFFTIAILTLLVVFLNKYMGLSFRNLFNLILTYKVLSLGIIALFLLGIIFLSLHFSYKYYKKRDF